MRIVSKKIKQPKNPMKVHDPVKKVAQILKSTKVKLPKVRLSK